MEKDLKTIEEGAALQDPTPGVSMPPADLEPRPEEASRPEEAPRPKVTVLPGKSAIQQELERIQGQEERPLDRWLDRISLDRGVLGRALPLLKGAAGTVFLVAAVILFILALSRFNAAGRALDDAESKSSAVTVAGAASGTVSDPASDTAATPQEEADRIIREAQDQAADILAEAYSRADAIIMEAEEYRQAIEDGGVEFNG